MKGPHDLEAACGGDPCIDRTCPCRCHTLMTAPTYPDIAAFVVAQLDREQAIAEDEQLVALEVMTSDATFMIANQPLKVLADIAAKRAILEAIWWVKGCNSINDLPASDAKTETGWDVLHHLAAPFAGQPGWQQEWAVGT